MAETNKDLLDEMRQPYRTPSERAIDRKARAQPGLFNTAPERPEDAPELSVAITVWAIQRQAEPGKVALVRSPSRSGAKIYMHDQHGWSGPFWSEVFSQPVAADATEYNDGVSQIPIYNAFFETVPEYAARLEQEKLGKTRR